MVAGRLSEDAQREVILLESGPDLRRGSVPAEIAGSSFLDALAVPGRTYPDLLATHVAGGAPRRYPRGRGLGGSSAVNAMVMLRGDAALYRAWGWDDVDSAWRRAALPSEEPADDELGAVDRALLAAAPDARPASLARHHGVRVTAAETMLWPARDRANLVIRTDAVVARVVLRGRRAVGVELISGEVIDADRVVLCAGAIHTPAILLRSGVDTPGVGHHLQDHPSAPFTLALRVAADPSSLAIGALLTRDPLQFLPMNHLGPGAAELGLLMVALMRPRGRDGSVRLRSDDPTAEPIVDFALLRDPRDMARLVEGVRIAQDLLRSRAFEAIADAVYIDAHGTSIDELGTDSAIGHWLTSAAGDYVHAASSCAMGSVVDDDGAVFGYEALAVCDASVFPSIPDVNTHAPTTMLAERLTARWRRRHATR